MDTADAHRSNHCRHLVLAAALLVLGGCSNIDVHHREDAPLPAGLTLLGPSSQPIVRNPDGTFCYGPPPDSTIDEQAGGAVKWLSFGDNSDELPLGGRNPNVLVTRDILFQSCLAETRLKLDPQQRIQLFYKTLEIVSRINAQSLDGTAVASDADSGSQTIPEPQIPGVQSKAASSGTSNSGSYTNGDNDGW